MAPIGRFHVATEESLTVREHNLPIGWRSNPLNPHPLGHTSSPPASNPTLDQREVYESANGALRDLLVGVETQEHTDQLLKDLAELKSVLSLAKSMCG